MPKAAAAADAAVDILPLNRIAGKLVDALARRRACGEDEANERRRRTGHRPGDAPRPTIRSWCFSSTIKRWSARRSGGRCSAKPAWNSAIAAIRTRRSPPPRRSKPTVILQDLVMPGVDGIELVRRYRADPATSGIPIIVLSTKEEPSVKSDAFKAGANDYLVKLPDQIELIARIRYHSMAYLTQRQRDEAYRALHESQQQLLETNRELKRLTNVDGLTGLSNRRYFNECIETEWKRSLRGSDHRFRS